MCGSGGGAVRRPFSVCPGLQQEKSDPDPVIIPYKPGPSRGRGTAQGGRVRPKPPSWVVHSAGRCLRHAFSRLPPCLGRYPRSLCTDHLPGVENTPCRHRPSPHTRDPCACAMAPRQGRPNPATRDSYPSETTPCRDRPNPATRDTHPTANPPCRDRPNPTTRDPYPTEIPPCRDRPNPTTRTPYPYENTFSFVVVVVCNGVQPHPPFLGNLPQGEGLELKLLRPIK